MPICVLILALCAVACGQLQHYGQWTARPGFKTEAMFFKNNVPILFEHNTSKVFLLNHTTPIDAPPSSIGYPFSDDSVLVCGNPNLRSSPFYRLNYLSNMRTPNFPYTANALTTYISPDDKYVIAQLGYNSTDGTGLFNVELFEFRNDTLFPLFTFPMPECPNSYAFRKRYSTSTATFLCSNRNVVHFFDVNITLRNVTLKQTLNLPTTLDLGSATLSQDGRVFAAVLTLPYYYVMVFTLQNGSFVNVQNLTSYAVSLRLWVEMTNDGSDIFVGCKDSTNEGISWFHRYGEMWSWYQTVLPVTSNMIDMALSQDQSLLLFRTLYDIILYNIIYPTDPTTTSPSSSSHDLSILLPSTSPASFASQSSSSGAQQASESSPNPISCLL